MPRDALANPVALSILGALLEQSMYPYQLATALADRGVPVNRGTVYDTLEAMTRAGWVEPQAAEQAGARPKRTPYALTEDGRDELVRRLDTQIRTPRREFTEFLGAVSHIGVLGPARAAEALSERAERLAVLMDEDHRHLDEALADGSVPRLFVIEGEYALTMMQTERDWVLALADEIRAGELAWPHR
ncbi:MAG: PadR family transcriptional regulator [Streptosporangiaceae bacterium]|jgi:DNA-binding PadR family transcriptional regulator